MIEDAKILRHLSWEYMQIANNAQNSENIKLRTAVNDLKQIRPVVLIDELPWNEMNINNELTLKCNDVYLREVEWFLRTTIYKHKYMPADMIIRPYIPVSKVINSSGTGILVEEKTIATDTKNSIVSHEYADLLKTDEDLEKLHNPVITYDEKESLRRYNLLGEVLGDIIPVKLTGVDYFTVST